MQLLNTLLISMPGGGEWIFIILAIILLFGGKKIPELMKGLGKGVKSFKDGVNDIEKQIESEPEPKKNKEADLEK